MSPGLGLYVRTELPSFVELATVVAALTDLPLPTESAAWQVRTRWTHTADRLAGSARGRMQPTGHRWQVLGQGPQSYGAARLSRTH